MFSQNFIVSFLEYQNMQGTFLITTIAAMIISAIESSSMTIRKECFSNFVVLHVNCDSGEQM